jgi:tetratricopeptide (TPR) repeat protein
MTLRPIGFLLLLGALAFPAPAQFWDTLFNPGVQVTLTHPPALGIKAKRVAFAPVDSAAAEDLVSACIADLANSGEIEVLDRGNIEKVLKEQKFSNAGLVGEAHAVELGKLLGSPVLIFVKVPHARVRHIPLHSTKPAWTDQNGVHHPLVTTYVSKTQLDFNASVQAVDLATGRIYHQQRIAVAPTREVSSDHGAPEFPSETEVREVAVGMARDQVHKMLLSWTEQRKLIFYDDKDYGMKDAYKRLQLNDTEGALQKSREALEAAGADPKAKAKYLGHANYNVGMCQFILGDYRAALPFLKAAREIDPKHKIYAGAETECLGAIKLEEEMRKVDANSAKLTVNPSRLEAPKAPEEGKPKDGGSVEERLERLEILKKKELVSPQGYEWKRTGILNDI